MLKKTLSAIAIAASLAAAPAAKADDYACTVLLCLAASPASGGWQAIPQCVPPIKRMLRDLFLGKGFPICLMQDGTTGGNYVTVSNDPYDPCPDGLQPAQQDIFVSEGEYDVTGRLIATGTAAKSEETIDDGNKKGPRACVATPLGTVTNFRIDYETNISVFKKVVWIPFIPGTSFDIYLNNRFSHKVRM